MICWINQTFKILTFLSLFSTSASFDLFEVIFLLIIFSLSSKSVSFLMKLAISPSITNLFLFYLCIKSSIHEFVILRRAKIFFSISVFLHHNLLFLTKSLTSGISSLTAVRASVVSKLVIIEFCLNLI